MPGRVPSALALCTALLLAAAPDSRPRVGVEAAVVGRLARGQLAIQHRV